MNESGAGLLTRTEPALAEHRGAFPAAPGGRVRKRSIRDFVQSAIPGGGHHSCPTILIGAGEHALFAAQEVAAARNGYSIVGLVPQAWEHPHPWLAGIPQLGAVEDLPALVGKLGAGAVVTTGMDTADHQFASILNACRREGAEVLDLPTLVERLSKRIPVQQVERPWLEATLGNRRPGLSYRLSKRLIDVAVSLLALTGLALVFPLLAPAIWFSTRGTPIFRQERVGLGGGVLSIFKLRSMVVHAEASGEPVWADVNDQRVTRLGRLLRKTRLDEVPQFFNVLRGEMSLVGPRPERPFFVERLRREIVHYDWRHTVPPGITGWAQVSQGYAACVEESLHKLELDLYYIKHRSLRLDLEILWRTVGVVLGHRGAR